MISSMSLYQVVGTLTLGHLNIYRSLIQFPINSCEQVQPFAFLCLKMSKNFWSCTEKKKNIKNWFFYFKIARSYILDDRKYSFPHPFSNTNLETMYKNVSWGAVSIFVTPKVLAKICFCWDYCSFVKIRWITGEKHKQLGGTSLQ